MNTALQNVAVVALVVAAASYLARVVWQSLAKRTASACGACGNCQTQSERKATATSQPVIEIDQLRATASNLQRESASATADAAR